MRPSAGSRPARREPSRSLDESDERSFNSGHGPHRGVTAAETRDRLLRGCRRRLRRGGGYDGTRVADIAAAAGVSMGALYAYLPLEGGGGLLVSALQTHGRRLLADMFAADPSQSVTDLLLIIGRRLPPASRCSRQPPRRGAGRGPPRRGRRPSDPRLRWRAGRLARRPHARRPGPCRDRPGAVTERRLPTSASCSPSAVRSSRPTCTRSTTKSGPPCSPTWWPVWRKLASRYRQEQHSEAVRLTPSAARGMAAATT